MNVCHIINLYNSFHMMHNSTFSIVIKKSKIVSVLLLKDV